MENKIPMIVALFAVMLVGVWGRQDFHKGTNLPQSCRELGRCCQGKNNTCQVKIGGSAYESRLKTKLTGKKEAKSYCYCDSSCTVLEDCCEDYADFCRPVDCVVAESWSTWSECDVTCGSGIKTRTKQILQEPLNGGKKCEPNKENAQCEGLDCKSGRDTYIKLRDTAYIISGRHGKWRVSSEYHPHKGIRKNIFDHFHGNSTDRPSHCVVFQMTQVNKGCTLSTAELTNLGFNDHDVEFLRSNIALEKQVCVECQDLAMREGLGGQCGGEGLVNQETSWSITPKCKGKWKMITRTEDCSCSNKDSEDVPDFLFV